MVSSGAWWSLRPSDHVEGTDDALVIELDLAGVCEEDFAPTSRTVGSPSTGNAWRRNATVLTRRAGQLDCQRIDDHGTRIGDRGGATPRRNHQHHGRAEATGRQPASGRRLAPASRL